MNVSISIAHILVECLTAGSVQGVLDGSLQARNRDIQVPFLSDGILYEA